MRYSKEEIQEEVKKAFVKLQDQQIQNVTDRVWEELVSRRAQEQPDPYLQPGWPCEVWDAGLCGKRLCYYVGEAIGEKMFVLYRNSLTEGAPGNPYTNYRPIGTEWDFAPKHAHVIQIDELGYAAFFDESGIFRFQQSLQTVLPEKYHGMTIRRPEWAKGDE